MEKYDYQTFIGQLEQLDKRITQLEKVLLTGNGQKSVLAMVSAMEINVCHITNQLNKTLGQKHTRSGWFGLLGVLVGVITTILINYLR
jgi:hypothetical protein